MELSPDRVQEIQKIAQEPLSLETPVGEDENSYLSDFIEDLEAISPADQTTYGFLKEQIEDLLDTLSDREENILRLRFGLDDGRRRTLEELGKVFNVTRDMLKTICKKKLNFMGISFMINKRLIAGRAGKNRIYHQYFI